MSVTDRFLRYIQIPTPSDSKSPSYPSNKQELELAEELKKELIEMGVGNAVIKDGVLYASIPANTPAKRAIGFIAHMDTVSEPGQPQVRPQVFSNYDGGTLALKGEANGVENGKDERNGIQISPKDFPQLQAYAGDSIITTDGTSVLGADDKAGVAEIMQMAEYICTHPEYRHGKIGIAFTSDEELGRGTETFDVPGFGCDFAYTIDGEEEGELSYETFNAAAFTITVRGENCHPGNAKGRMVNAVNIATELTAAFPADERPEATEGREGYFFINHIEGGVDEVKIEGIIRDHDREAFEARKDAVRSIAASFNSRYPGRLSLTMKDEYYNCAQMILPYPHLIHNAEEAMRKNGIQPKIIPVRGGTDGSMLSFKGLPCPNIGTGGLGAHSLKECIPAGAMERMTQVLLDIVSAYAEEQ